LESFLLPYCIRAVFPRQYHWLLAALHRRSLGRQLLWRTMRDVSGVTGAAPVWLEIIEWLQRETPSLPPQPPAGVLARQVAFPQEIEPARMEWFLTGTEPQVSTLTLAVSHPHILAPAAGTVIALDPDIPPPLQRVVFEAQARGTQLRWVLDGTDLGAAADVLLWEPTPGSHTLSLVDEKWQAFDTVNFTVHGSLASAVTE
jgi:penicillin-binding protein 1C